MEATCEYMALVRRGRVRSLGVKLKKSKLLQGCKVGTLQDQVFEDELPKGTHVMGHSET